MREYIYNNIVYPNLPVLRKAHPNLVFPDTVDVPMLEELGVTVRDLPDPPLPVETAEEVAKYERRKAIEALVVTVDGIDFEGNETAQSRMLRVLYATPEDGTVEWVDAHNAVHTITRAQLQQAYNLAIAKMEELWIVPYGSEA